MNREEKLTLPIDLGREKSEHFLNNNLIYHSYAAKLKIIHALNRTVHRNW